MALASQWLWARRVAQVMPFLTGPLLDVGSGNCAVRPHVRGEYVGLDRELTFLPPQAAVQRTLGSAERLPFRDATFATVLAMAVVEHVDDPVACMREARRVLLPGGCLVMTTPTPIGDRIHHQLAKVNITSKHAADEHQSILRLQELRRAATAAGFDVEHLRVFLLGGNQLCVARRPTRDAVVLDRASPAHKSHSEAA